MSKARPKPKARTKTTAHRRRGETRKPFSVDFEAKEFPHHEKNHLWYLGIGVLLLALLLLTLSYREYLIAAVVVALALAIFRLARIEPGNRSIKIDEQGIRWGDEFLAYHQFKAFWAIEQSGKVTIYLERPNLSASIHFSVPESKAVPALAVLSEFLPWHTHRGEPISDRLNRFLRL